MPTFIGKTEFEKIRAMVAEKVSTDAMLREKERQRKSETETRSTPNKEGDSEDSDEEITDVESEVEIEFAPEAEDAPRGGNTPRETTETLGIAEQCTEISAKENQEVGEGHEQPTEERPAEPQKSDEYNPDRSDDQIQSPEDDVPEVEEEVTDLHLLDKWYKEDENAEPSTYVLQPISTHLPDFKNKVGW